MAFDFSKLDGYREDMSAEEKLALLDGYTEPEPAPAQNAKMIAKEQFDKVSSELAAAKKQLRAKMTEAEQQESDRAAQQEQMLAELEALRREKTVSMHKASYMALGYEEKLAEDTALAMADGDTDTVFANMRKAMQASEQKMRAEILKSTPTPPAGDDPDAAKQRKQAAQMREWFGLPPLN